MCGLTNPNNVDLDGWVLENQDFGFPVKKKICTPRNTVFIHVFFKCVSYLLIKYFLRNSSEIESHCIIWW